MRGFGKALGANHCPVAVRQSVATATVQRGDSARATAGSSTDHKRSKPMDKRRVRRAIESRRLHSNKVEGVGSTACQRGARAPLCGEGSRARRCFYRHRGQQANDVWIRRGLHGCGGMRTFRRGRHRRRSDISGTQVLRCRRVSTEWWRSPTICHGWHDHLQLVRILCTSVGRIESVHSSSPPAPVSSWMTEIFARATSG